MTFSITITNPYETSSIKDLLEVHLLVPRKNPSFSAHKEAHSYQWANH